MRFSIVLTATFAIFATTATFAAPPSTPQLQQLKKSLAKAASDGKKISSYHIHVVHRPSAEQQQQKTKAQLQRKRQYEESELDPSILAELANNPILNSLLDKYGDSQDATYDDAPDSSDTLPTVQETEGAQEGEEEDEEEVAASPHHHGHSVEKQDQKSPKDDDDTAATGELRRRQLDGLPLADLLQLLLGGGGEGLL